MRFFKKHKKAATIDFSNFLIKKFDGKRYFFRVVFLGKINIKRKLKKNLLIIFEDRETIIYGFKKDFTIENFIKRVNKILKTQ